MCQTHVLRIKTVLKYTLISSNHQYENVSICELPVFICFSVQYKIWGIMGTIPRYLGAGISPGVPDNTAIRNMNEWVNVRIKPGIYIMIDVSFYFMICFWGFQLRCKDYILTRDIATIRAERKIADLNYCYLNGNSSQI